MIPPRIMVAAHGRPCRSFPIAEPIEPVTQLGYWWLPQRPMRDLVAREAEPWGWFRDRRATLHPRRCSTSGTFLCPEFYLTDHYVHQIGGLFGQPPHGGDPGDSERVADGLVDPAELAAMS